MKTNDIKLQLYKVYRQLAPARIGEDDWKACLLLVGEVFAYNSTHALQEARAQKLAVAPIVEAM